MNNPKETHNALVAKVARKYEKNGYKVYIEPNPSVLPFDLRPYRPDLLARKPQNGGYIIEVKSKAAHASIDRLRDIAETVDRHKGWHFMLITGDDVLFNEPEEKGRLLSWEQILTQKEQAKELYGMDKPEAAFLMFWGIIEAMMRKQAGKSSIPVERFPTSPLIKHLYSQGELSMEQFDKIMNLLNIRNQFVHGFQLQGLDEATNELEELVSELLKLWYPQ